MLLARVTCYLIEQWRTGYVRPNRPAACPKMGDIFSFRGIFSSSNKSLRRVTFGFPRVGISQNPFKIYLYYVRPTAVESFPFSFFNVATL